MGKVCVCFGWGGWGACFKLAWDMIIETKMKSTSQPSEDLGWMEHSRQRKTTNANMQKNLEVFQGKK